MHNIRYVFRKLDTDVTQNTVTNYSPRHFIKYPQYQKLFRMIVIDMKKRSVFYVMSSYVRVHPPTCFVLSGS
jgi:hypothetical protein